MARTFGATDIVDAVRKEISSATYRARNSINYLTMEKAEGLNPSPRVLVGSREKVNLWKYPSANKKYAEPIVVFLGLVSRSYVLDLLPGKSLIGLLTEAGYDVYVVDWGQPDAAEADNTLETYVDFYLPRAFKLTQKDSGSKDIHVIAYCFGSIFSLMYQGSRRNSPIKSMVTLAAIADLRHMPVHTQPFQDGSFNPDDVINDEGYVPADTIYRGMSVRNPTFDVAQAVGLWEKLASDPDSKAVEAHAVMSNWIKDHVNFPGAAFKQFVQQFLQDNAFVNGTARAGNKPVDLTGIDIPILSVIAERDDLIPPPVSFPMRDMLREDVYNEVIVPAGHVGLVLGSSAKKFTAPAIANFFAEHSTPAQEEAR